MKLNPPQEKSQSAQLTLRRSGECAPPLLTAGKLPGNAKSPLLMRVYPPNRFHPFWAGPARKSVALGARPGPSSSEALMKAPTEVLHRIEDFVRPRAPQREF
jgi:hypothetical protein